MALVMFMGTQYNPARRLRQLQLSVQCGTSEADTIRPSFAIKRNSISRWRPADPALQGLECSHRDLISCVVTRELARNSEHGKTIG